MKNLSIIKRTLAFAVVLLLILSSCGKPVSEPVNTIEPEITEKEESTADFSESTIDTPIFSEVSAVRIRDDEGVAHRLYSTATGIHGGHESRVVRTENGTFAVYITAEYPDENYDFTWDNYSNYDVMDTVYFGYLDNWEEGAW